MSHTYTIFSQKKNDQLQEPMFFGQPVNVARFDQQKYPIFEKLIEKQLSFFWRQKKWMCLAIVLTTMRCLIMRNIFLSAT